ncbi:cryptochrome/photolyase family protein [Ferrovibrio terrae]|uniref:cryptochrome/photolyase family protein n=1 Tax=Ferrovibrio terrae TaxID=2594003 RepID=UPI0031381AAC
MTGATLRLVLGDQLSPTISSLRDSHLGNDTVLIAEVMSEATYVRHHKKKIAFLFSAMRHFAEELRQAGHRVIYVRLDDADNTGSLYGEVSRHADMMRADRIVVTEPGEWRLKADMEGWAVRLARPVDILEDDRFLCSHVEFRRWAANRKELRMEFFYREMRRRHDILMDAAGKPEGGRWNFDSDNRRSLRGHEAIPRRPDMIMDAVTRQVIDLVERVFAQHFGDIEPFDFAVTSIEAERLMEWFFRHALPYFGDYQDAMQQGAPFLFHSLLSPYLNCGLLDPRELCRRAETEWRKGRAPLNAVEGFIRQILGWREFIRGVYWLEMPGYARSNALAATRPLPWFYWSGQTAMNCIAQVVGETRRNAYAHHIQRLMVTGNFALLAGIAPAEVEAWYLAVYADAYDWVELPNTHGMALFADGGRLASKPYAASGKYIQRMSDYCRPCRYDVKQTLGSTACPFNALYWDFLSRNADRLGRNPRLAMPYRNLARMPASQRQAISLKAAEILASLDDSDRGSHPAPAEQMPLLLAGNDQADMT